MMKIDLRKKAAKLACYHDVDFDGLLWRGWRGGAPMLTTPLRGAFIDGKWQGLLPADRVQFLADCFPPMPKGKMGRPATVLAIDLVASAMKTVSIAGLVQERHEFVRAHMQASLEVVRFLPYFLRVGRGVAPLTLPAIWLFPHALSALNDPLLHMHMLIPARTPAGAVDASRLLTHGGVLSAIYDAALAARVCQFAEIRVIDRAKMRWELAGYDERVIAAFSRRAVAIAAEAGENVGARYRASMRQRRALEDDSPGKIPIGDVMAGWRRTLDGVTAGGLGEPRPALAGKGLDVSEALVRGAFTGRSVLSQRELFRYVFGQTLGTTTTPWMARKKLRGLASRREPEASLVWRGNEVACRLVVESEGLIVRATLAPGKWRASADGHSTGAVLLRAARELGRTLSVFVVPDRREAKMRCADLGEQLGPRASVCELTWEGVCEVDGSAPIVAVAPERTPSWHPAKDLVEKLSGERPGVILLPGMPARRSVWHAVARPLNRDSPPSPFITLPNHRQVSVESVHPGWPFPIRRSRLRALLQQGTVQIVCTSEDSVRRAEGLIEDIHRRLRGRKKLRVRLARAGRGAATDLSPEEEILIARKGRLPRGSRWRVWQRLADYVSLMRCDRSRRGRVVRLSWDEFAAVVDQSLRVPARDQEVVAGCQLIRVGDKRGVILRLDAVSTGKLHVSDAHGVASELPNDSIFELGFVRRNLRGPACDTLVVLPEVVDHSKPAELTDGVRHCGARKVILLTSAPEMIMDKLPPGRVPSKQLVRSWVAWAKQFKVALEPPAPEPPVVRRRSAPAGLEEPPMS